MNQFHTPSFGDEVFEMNESPMDQAQQQTPSRRISRLSSLDQSTLVDGQEEQMGYDPSGAYNSNQMMGSQPQQQQQQHQQPPPQLQPQTSQQSPAKPLAPYALFFRDTMTAIKQQNPACTLEQITSIALNMWESMDEKQKTVYDQRHEVEKREYLRQLRDQQRNQHMVDPTASLNMQPQQQQQELQQPSAAESMPEGEAPCLTTASNESVSTQSPSDQIQLLTEAAAVQKCTREQCNKPAIINPDWEDEYCSNECVVIHCRNVFTEWARSLQNSPT